jgi:hypothetical protein
MNHDGGTRYATRAPHNKRVVCQEPQQDVPMEQQEGEKEGTIHAQSSLCHGALAVHDTQELETICCLKGTQTHTSFVSFLFFHYLCLNE